MNTEFKSANPILPVKSAFETARYYEQRLGFEIEVLWHNPNYAVVKRGCVRIEFGEGRPEHIGSGVCYIHVQNVDAVYEEFKTAKVEILGELEDRDYGSRDFRVKDNEGNTLIIGSPLANQRMLQRDNAA